MGWALLPASLGDRLADCHATQKRRVERFEGASPAVAVLSSLNPLSRRSPGGPARLQVWPAGSRGGGTRQPTPGFCWSSNS
jgi:hypothetical protein